MTRVELRNLSKRYPHAKRPAVHCLDLEVSPGEIAALLGPSGCGKTTTLKMIAGLLDPTEGDILFDGRSVVEVPAEKRNAVMVFQEHALFPFMSVGENIGFGLRVRGFGAAEIRRRTEEMLDLVRLPGIAARRPKDLSGGQRQRVALARALVTEPRLLLLDEPLANLDAHLRDEMRALILSVQRQTGVTTLVVTHDQEEAVLLADRIALLFDGELHQAARPAAFFRQPVSERAARFFGGKNFIPAERTGNIARTPLGDFSLDPARSALMPEGRVLLTIRPEHIRLDSSTEANAFDGVLASCIFMGTHTRCRLEAGGFAFEAYKTIDATAAISEGPIRIVFPSEHIWLFPLSP